MFFFTMAPSACLFSFSYCYCEWSIFHEISAPVYLCIVTLCNWYICCRHWFFCVHFYFYWSSMNLQLQCTMGFHITFKEMEQFFSNRYCDFNFHGKLLKPFLHDRQLPKEYAKYFLIKYDQYLQRYLQKKHEEVAT